MHGPPLVAWLLVALSAATGLSCLLRHEARDEALLAAGMAVMAVPLSVVDPRPWATAVSAAVFTLTGIRALVAAPRHGHRLHHSLCSAAMVYMAVAMTGAGTAHTGHTGHTGGGTPLLTGLLLAYFAGYVLLSGVRMVTVVGAPAAAPPIPGGGPLRHAPELAMACRVSMALAMFTMLLAL